MTQRNETKGSDLSIAAIYREKSKLKQPGSFQASPNTNTASTTDQFVSHKLHTRTQSQPSLVSKAAFNSKQSWSSNLNRAMDADEKQILLARISNNLKLAYKPSNKKYRSKSRGRSKRSDWVSQSSENLE